MNIYDVVIIGAGPAGLTLGKFLQGKKKFVILEKTEAAGASWSNMPDNLKVISPWKCNSLPGFDPVRLTGNIRIPAKEYAKYLVDYCKHFDLPVVYHQSVEKISKEDGLFRITTQGRELTAKSVVCATGYYSAPKIPAIESDGSVIEKHFCEFKNAKDLGENKKILIVGKRLSAGQLLIECVEENHRVGISVRSKIEYTSGPIVFGIMFRFLSQLEQLRLWFLSDKRKPIDVKMEAEKAKDIVESGKVKLHPNLKKIENGLVVFEDGSSDNYDYIFYATGFKPALSYLKDVGISLDETGRPELVDSFESNEVDNLFFLGLDAQRDFRSRFIRGIREDARILSERL